MPVYLRQLELGPMQNFVYLVGDPETKEAAVVDPAWNVPAILQQAKTDGYRLTHVFLSHGHYDHINGVEDIVRATDATVCAEKTELEEFVFEGMGGLVVPRSSLKKTDTNSTIHLGKLRVRTIHTPGHTPGSQCFFIEKATPEGYILLTGDTLFVGTIGRCDFPYSSPKAHFESLQKIKALADDTEILPGHDYGAAPTARLGKEKKANPYLMVSEFHQFLQMIRR